MRERIMRLVGASSRFIRLLPIQSYSSNLRVQGSNDQSNWTDIGTLSHDGVFYSIDTSREGGDRQVSVGYRTTVTYDSPGDTSVHLPRAGSYPIPSWVSIDFSDRPAACKGCRNYYGQTHGGNRLICGIHACGPSGDDCPDWEANPIH